MDTPVDEQKRFDYITGLISSSVDEVSRKGCLSLKVLEQVIVIFFSFSRNLMFSNIFIFCMLNARLFIFSHFYNC